MHGPQARGIWVAAAVDGGGGGGGAYVPGMGWDGDLSSRSATVRRRSSALDLILIQRGRFRW